MWEWLRGLTITQETICLWCVEEIGWYGSIGAGPGPVGQLINQDMRQMRGAKFRLYRFLSANFWSSMVSLPTSPSGDQHRSRMGQRSVICQNEGSDESSSAVRSKERQTVAGYGAAGHLATLGRLEFTLGQFSKLLNSKLNQPVHQDLLVTSVRLIPCSSQQLKP